MQWRVEVSSAMFPYEEGLAPFACTTAHSRGRHYEEPESPGRNVFQRDRDRIIHSTAFRRLEYKTQVFVNHEGDHYRTRLTHSIEVGQVAVSICRALMLHEDLAQAVALAHDLGHTPFGHSGQDALDEVMKPYGGFEHNRQSLRVVEKLEQRYIGFPGLNLSYEAREGIIKHSSAYDAPEVLDCFHADEQATLEAQIGNLADEIAYNNHDVDDGIRAGILCMRDLNENELFRRHYDEVMAAHPGVDERRAMHEIVRRMISFLITDVINETRRRLQNSGISNLADVRCAQSVLVGFSSGVRRMNDELKAFLYKNMYRNYRVARMAKKAERVIQSIFLAYLDEPAMLPEAQTYKFNAAENKDQQARVVADYIAGMTDRYALEEHDRLFDLHART